MLYSMFRHFTIGLQRIQFSLKTLLCIGTSVLSTLPLSANSAPISWTETTEGLSFARYMLAAEAPVMQAEMLLILIDPAKFDFRLVQALEVKKGRTTIEKLAQSIDGLIAINTHYFDTDGKALGLIINNRNIEHKLHRGGGVLTGVFYLKGNTPAIVYRDQIEAIHPDLALQAGPRIVVNAQGTDLKPNSKANRRSGIAVTKNGKVLLYATSTRFPGARMEQIQQMLLDPELEVVDALNLDGGSSSQLFVAATVSPSDKELLYSGGDLVPVGLVVTRKPK